LGKHCKEKGGEELHLMSGKRGRAALINAMKGSQKKGLRLCERGEGALKNEGSMGRENQQHGSGKWTSRSNSSEREGLLPA